MPRRAVFDHHFLFLLALIWFVEMHFRHGGRNRSVLASHLDPLECLRTQFLRARV